MSTITTARDFWCPSKLGVKHATELNGATVCVLPGTTTEQNAADYFRSHNMKWKPVVIEATTELRKTFFAGRCDVLTSDASQLAAVRSMAPNPKDYVLLPEIISKEPLAPAVRQGDEQWRDIVDFSVMAMIEAEELGITSKNVDEMLKSKDPKVQRFLGVTPGNGKALGLDEKWAYNIVKQVGNYGEVFDAQRRPEHLPRSRTGSQRPVDPWRPDVLGAFQVGWGRPTPTGNRNKPVQQGLRG